MSAFNLAALFVTSVLLGGVAGLVGAHLVVRYMVRGDVRKAVAQSRIKKSLRQQSLEQRTVVDPNAAGPSRSRTGKMRRKSRWRLQ